MIAGWVVSVGFSALVLPAQAQDVYCAFAVKVTTPSGEAVPKVPVYLIRNLRSTLFSTRTDANGVATLCDAPLEALDIGVGFDICGSVVVRNLQPRWPKTQHVFVTYVKHTCDFIPVRADCTILLRIEDEEARPVTGAQFHTKASTGPSSAPSDAYGRLFASVKRSEKLEGIVSKKDYEPERISLQCVDDVGQKIVLRKR